MTFMQDPDQEYKSFDECMKERLRQSKNKNRKHSNKKFYMLFIAYKIMKKILLNPRILEKELNLVNSQYSKEIINKLLDRKFISVKEYDLFNNKFYYELTIEGLIYVEFIDSFLSHLDQDPYNDSDIDGEDEDHKLEKSLFL